MIEIKDFISYIIHKKDIEDELESLDRELDIYKAKYSHKNKELEEAKKENEILVERNSKHLKTIRELRKEIKGLKNDKEI